MSILTDQQLDHMEMWVRIDLGAGEAHLEDVVTLIAEVRELRKLRAAIETAIAAAREVAS